MTCSKKGCGRQYPWGITAADGICFPCRWPDRWSEKDEAAYRAALERGKKPPANKV